MRRALLAVLAAALLAAPALAARKTRKPPRPQLPGERVEFTTTDGWTLVGRFTPPRDGHLTFLMLHGVGSNSGEWANFAIRLISDGYGVLAYDGRGHNESQMFGGQKVHWRSFRSTGTTNEWNLMSYDVEAALAFLSSAGVQSSSVAFVGASVGANVMLKAAVAHKEVPLAILLSPGINYRDVMTVNPIRAYGKRPILIAAATGDGYAHQSSTLLYNLALPISGADKALFLQAEAGHGAPLLDQNPALLDAVMAWVSAEERGEPFTLQMSTAPGVSTGSATSNR